MNKKIKIIIADDNAVWCELMREYLEKKDTIYILGTTADGQEQIEMTKYLKPDIVITDLKRDKGISGMEAIEKCINLENDTRFIIQTAGDYYQEEINILRNLKIISFFSKPFDLQDLMKVVDKIRKEKENSTKNINIGKGNKIWKRKYFFATKQR